NVEGAGHFYTSRQEAVAAVQGFQGSGAQSIDVGCMQVNLMHHPNAFASLGDWGTAIAAYHSRTPGVGEPYRDQVVATWNPKDPAVLAKLSFQPLPALPARISGLPMIYAPFAAAGPVQIAPNMAYRAFLPASNVYGAFRPASATYADFARKPVKPARGQPLDLRLNMGLASSGRALVLPTGVVERRNVKPATMKQVARRDGETG